MRNSYVGNIGDYGKYGLLRALTGESTQQEDRLSLGVVWYQTKSERPESGNFYYLDHDDEYRACDPVLFDRLKAMRDGARSNRSTGYERSLRSIQDSDLLGEGTEFFDELVPPGRECRKQWFGRALDCVSDADLIFLDPDRGLRVYNSEVVSDRVATVDELKQVVESGKVSVVYHHHEGFAFQFRSRGTASQLMRELSLQLPPMALLYSPGRTDFFIVLPKDPSSDLDMHQLIYRRIERLVHQRDSKWANKGHFVARLGDQTDRATFERGLMILSEGIDDYLQLHESILKREYGARWIHRAIDECYENRQDSKDRKQYNDPIVRLELLRYFAANRTLKIREPDDKDVAYIRNRRNDWAHFDEFNTGSASKSLEVMLKVLQSINDPHRTMRMLHLRKLLEQRPPQWVG